MSQKKQVFSIPINLDTKQFQGTNLLISKGSGIYLKPDSVLNALKINKTSDFNGKFDFSCINGNTIEEIKKISGTDEGLIQKTLLKLILEGRVFQSEGRYYKC